MLNYRGTNRKPWEKPPSLLSLMFMKMVVLLCFLFLSWASHWSSDLCPCIEQRGILQQWHPGAKGGQAEFTSGSHVQVGPPHTDTPNFSCVC